MNFENYFEREYNFLQSSGEEFSKKHPTLGAQLHLSERHRKDPFVERLFEGFSFLAGRIHERLDDEFPEITGGLLELLFPQMLKPFPAASILQAKIKPGSITKPLLIKKGNEIQTLAGKYKVKYRVHSGAGESSRLNEKEEPTEFIFRTTQDFTIRPMKINSVKISENPDGNSSLIIRIQPDRNSSFESLELDKLQLYLNGSGSVRYNLVYHLLKFVKSLEIREIINEDTPFKKVENFKIGIPELSDHLEYEPEDISILPFAKQMFSGYRLLLEYFSFPEKFMFVDLTGLDRFVPSGDYYSFEIRINFSRKINRDLYPSEQNILINCVPIVNLFNRPVEEVIMNQRMPEYYIVPDIDRRKSREIYSINGVTGVSENKIEQYKYVPISAHEILDQNDPDYDIKRFYSVTRKPARGDMAESYIRLFGMSMEKNEFEKETLSLNATLSNGFLPSAYLEVGSINQPLSFPPGIEISNISKPSEVLECPDKQNFLWSLIAHLSINYTSLANEENLKSILNLYNWVVLENHSNRKKINGIKKVYPPKQRNIIKNQTLVKGIEFKIEINREDFEYGDGDIYLFGMILNKFLSQYVTLNSFVFLKIIELGTERQHVWEPNLGQIVPV